MHGAEHYPGYLFPLTRQCLAIQTYYPCMIDEQQQQQYDFSGIFF
jgi:hypothetical protein